MCDSFVHVKGLILARFEYGSANMQRLDGCFVYSASDLNDYLECKRLTELEALVARKRVLRPDSQDERTELIRRKGEEHEQRHLDALIERYPGEVVRFERAQPGVEQYRQAEARTLEAMRSGVRVIYQATFFDGEFIGHADFLRRVEVPSRLGDYGYEVVDTKLALAPKAYNLVQLCNYSEHLERLQGRLPEFGHVVFGNGEEQRFRMNDYMAYYRHLKRAFLDFANNSAFDRMEEPNEYPRKCKHCVVCTWNEACTNKRESDDHLSLVAWMRRDQIAKLEAGGIERVAQLALAEDDRRPTGMSPETFIKLRRQASLQVRGRDSLEPIYELLECPPPLGFSLLPPPSAGDVFFDMEGDPLYEPGRGLEYLFGCWMPDDDPAFRAFWGLDRAEEKRAFEQFVDFVIERRSRFPALHVYHYANYEKSALRRLAQEHSTRENEIDDLLRAEVLVDLFAVVRQALAISQDGYGLKKLERFYELRRETEVKKGDDSIVQFERWLLAGDRRILDDIEAYNRDDCRSTQRLRDWLLARRIEAAAKFGIDFPFRPLGAPKDRARAEAEEEERGELERALLANVLVPKTEEEYGLMGEERRARYLLGSLLAYHRREAKPQWWAYFDRCENVDRLLEFDREAIAGLVLREDIPPQEIKRSKIYTYAFPEQHHKMSPGDAVDPRTKKVARIVSIDDESGLLEIKTTSSLEAARAITELIPSGPPETKPQRAALARIARSFLAGTLSREHPATYDLLARRPPHLSSSEKRVLQPPVINAEAVFGAMVTLEKSYLFIQGPPGSGKSTYGSQLICDLLERGKRVAVTSTSHAAIHNLLHKVEECMAKRRGRFRGRYKHSDKNAGSEFRSKLAAAMIESVGANEDLDGGDYQLCGGTAWLLARDEFDGKFDYLFIDEAGQVALADALALSLCAQNVVLLGDPSQLAQVSQGRQPPHAGDSVLQHLLGDKQTVPMDRGIFLDFSYRMQPEICAFISDAMYEGRLQPSEEAREHRVTVGVQELAGLYFVPVEHAGNGSRSDEEADEIVRQIATLHRYERDVIVVTPYNAQRRLITAKLASAGLAVRVGTVDKFQGQEAAVVFYSMASSSGDDMPRDMEFLFERNRFNVAISRARAVSVLVCSPRLLDISCRSPEEMALANLLCAFVERAKCGLELSYGEGNDRSVAGPVELETPRGRA
ncbi:MAG: TM0106 family RecB-like putative nuclease [Candidatus Cybelea sp.]